MKRLLILMLLLLSCVFPLRAQESLTQAEELYAQGKYAQALTMYEQILKNHPNDPYVYYNIGNCYFKMGSKGLAAANYYRAFRKAPRDGDIRHNLELALSSSGEKWIPTGVPHVLHRAFFGLSLAELTGLVSVLFWACCLLACVWLLKRRGAKWFVAVFVVWIVTLGWWYVRTQHEQEPLAVVASPVAEIRSSPNTQAPANANVAQGHLLLIEDSKDAWYKVVVKSQGLSGWVEKNAVEKI